MSMATRLAVMDAGRIVQTGSPHDLYERPASRFVADFIGIANILQTGTRRWLALRPEKIALSAEQPDTAHHVAGKILDIAYEGDRSLYRIATEQGGVLMVSSTNVGRLGQTFRRSKRVWLAWSADAGQTLDE